MAKKERKQMLPKEKTRIQDELDTLRMIRSYTEYKLPDDMKLKGIEKEIELLLADDTKLEKVVLLDLEGPDDDLSKVLEVRKEVLSKDRIEAISGLERPQIRELLARGLTIESIEERSIEIAEEQGMLKPEAMKQEIIEDAVQEGEIEPLPEEEIDFETDEEIVTLPGMEMIPLEERDISSIEDQTGTLVSDLENGDMEITTLEERMEITKDGGKFEEMYIEMLERDLAEDIEKYKMFGDTSELEAELRAGLDKKLAGTELVLDEGEKDKLVLKAVSKDERDEKEKAEDEEKKKIAEALGEDPDNILGIIRFKSVDQGSEMTNRKLSYTNDTIAVRLPNNNFKLLEEVSEGTSPNEQKLETPDGPKSYMELEDYSINPLMNGVAPALKDTAHSGYTDLLAGESKAGKTNPNSNRYDVIQIVRAGEKKMDDQDYIMYIGLNGERVTDVVTNHGTGLDFDREGVEIDYPGEVYIQGKEYDIHDKEDAEKERQTGDESQALDKALSKRIALLKKLLELEKQIATEENDKTPDLTIVAGQMIGGGSVKDGIEYSEESRQVRLEEAYDQRADVINELGYKESDLTLAIEEAERAEEEAKTLGPAGAMWN